MSGSEAQDHSPVGAQLADSEERRRRFSVQPLRRLLSIKRGARTGADREYPGQRKALQLGKGAFLIVLALVALLLLGMVSLWLIHSPTPAGRFWSHRLPHL
jgi:hypothetical protein